MVDYLTQQSEGMDMSDTDDDIAQALNEVMLDDAPEAKTDETPVEESTEETTEESPASDEAEESEATEEVQEDEETEGEPEAEETEAEEEAVETDPEETRKEAARQAYQVRQQVRRERENAIEQAKLEDLQQAQEQGADDEQIAIKQLQWTNYENTVTNNTDKLQNQFERAVAEIELFKNPSPAVKKMLDAAVDEFQALNVTFDQLGNPIQVRGNLTEHLIEKSSLISELTKLGEVQGKSNAARQKAAVTPKPNAAPKEVKKDPSIAAFEAAFGL